MVPHPRCSTWAVRPRACGLGARTGARALAALLPQLGAAGVLYDERVLPLHLVSSVSLSCGLASALSQTRVNTQSTDLLTSAFGSARDRSDDEFHLCAPITNF